MADIGQLKQLREETGISLAECKKALEESGGSIEQAKEILRKRGIEMAKGKQDREAGEGRIHAYIHGTGKTGVLLDLRCETDFVARADDFETLAHEVSLHIAAMMPESVEELLGQPYVRDAGKTVEELLKESIAKLGENIVIRRFVRYQIG